ncbi:hypothetical protein D3C73_1321080 [compost metagenome]
MNWYIKIPVYKGDIKYYEKQLSDKMILPLTDEEYDNIYVKQQIMPVINPPAEKGLKIGNVELYIDEEKLYEKEVFLDVNINKNKIFDYILDGITHMFDEISPI